MSSAARTAPVSSTSRPRRALSSVDLPAPDSPSTIATTPSGTSDRTASTPQGTPSARAHADTRPTSSSRSAEDVSASGHASPSTSRTAATSRARTSSEARSAFVSTTATSAPQSRAITAERASRSQDTGRSPSCCTTSTRSTLAASVWRSPRAPPRQRAMSLSRGENFLDEAHVVAVRPSCADPVPHRGAGLRPSREPALGEPRRELGAKDGVLAEHGGKAPVKAHDAAHDELVLLGPRRHGPVPGGAEGGALALGAGELAEGGKLGQGGERRQRGGTCRRAAPAPSLG